MVAAEDEVPRAVKYAGSMFARSFSGFLPVTAPAMQNCSNSRRMCRAKMTPMMAMNIFTTCRACPVYAMHKKMPKI